MHNHIVGEIDEYTLYDFIRGQYNLVTLPDI